MNTCAVCEKQYNKDRSKGHRGELCSSCMVTWKRHQVKKKAIDYKGGKCNNCGYNKCDSALTFHHLDPSQKDFGISDEGLMHKWDITKQELDKCVLLCVRCHAEEHDRMSKRQKLIEYKLQSEAKETIIRHGTKVAYSYHKCRCNECKAFNAASMREYKRKNRANAQ
jgi:5-methylcytosine-specific restriction endonuclease McrA